MLLSLHFRDARTWRYMVASIEKILDEGVFIADSEGLKLRALDPSHVVMVDLFYPRSAFSEFETSREEVSFGVSFETLYKVLRRARKDDEISFKVDEAYITVTFKGRGERSFRIPQITLTMEKLPEPKIQFTVRAKMISGTFREAVKDLETLAEVVTLAVPEDSSKLLMIGEGDIGSVELELSEENQSLLELSAESPDKASYSLEYFTQLNQAAQAADTVTISYAMDAPVRIDLDYLGGGRLTFYISPRME